MKSLKKKFATRGVCGGDLPASQSKGTAPRGKVVFFFLSRLPLHSHSHSKAPSLSGTLAQKKTKKDVGKV